MGNAIDSQLEDRVPMAAEPEQATGSACYDVDLAFHNKGIIMNHLYSLFYVVKSIFHQRCYLRSRRTC